jgi:hypothetical protein
MESFVKIDSDPSLKLVVCINSIWAFDLLGVFLGNQSLFSVVLSVSIEDSLGLISCGCSLLSPSDCEASCRDKSQDNEQGENDNRSDVGMGRGLRHGLGTNLSGDSAVLGVENICVSVHIHCDSVIDCRDHGVGCESREEEGFHVDLVRNDLSILENDSSVFIHLNSFGVLRDYEGHAERHLILVERRSLVARRTVSCDVHFLPALVFLATDACLLSLFEGERFARSHITGLEE